MSPVFLLNVHTLAAKSGSDNLNYIHTLDRRRLWFRTQAGHQDVTREKKKHLRQGRDLLGKT